MASVSIKAKVMGNCGYGGGSGGEGCDEVKVVRMTEMVAVAAADVSMPWMVRSNALKAFGMRWLEVLGNGGTDACGGGALSMIG